MMPLCFIMNRCLLNDYFGSIKFIDHSALIKLSPQIKQRCCSASDMETEIAASRVGSSAGSTVKRS